MSLRSQYIYHYQNVSQWGKLSINHTITKLLQKNMQNIVRQNVLKKTKPPNGEHEGDCPQHTTVVSQDRTSTQVTPADMAWLTPHATQLDSSADCIPSQLSNNSLTDSPVWLQQFGGPKDSPTSRIHSGPTSISRPREYDLKRHSNLKTSAI